MRKKRRILFLLILTLILLGIIVAAVVFYKMHGKELIREGIVTGAKEALQVDVRLEAVDLLLSSGTVDLRNLQIDSPAGYKNPTFLTMAHAHIDLDLRSLLSDTVEITDLRIDDVYIVIEQKGKTNNLKEILNNLPKSQIPESQPAPEKKKHGKDIRINVLEINNVQVEVKLLPIPGRADLVRLKLDPIRLENVGRDYTVDSSELSAMIIKALSLGILEKGQNLLPIDMVGSLAESLGQQGLNILKTGQKVGEEIIKGAQGLEKGTTDTIKGVGDLFRKKEDE